MNDRLFRSRSDRMLAGVAGGLAERFDLDPSLVRVGWAILVILSGGIFLLIYIVMAIVVPEEPTGGGGWWSTGGSAGSAGWSSGWPDPGVGPVQPGGPVAPPSSPLAAATGVLAAADESAPADAPPTATGTGPGFAAPAGSAWPSQPGPPPPLLTGRDARREARHATRDARRASRRAEFGFGPSGPRPGAVVGGLVLVALGAYFLVQALAPQLGLDIDFDLVWPSGLIVLGIILVGLSVRRTPGGPLP